MTGDQSSGGGGFNANYLQAFNANGFQVGSDFNVNGKDGNPDSDNTYYWTMLTGELQDPDSTGGYAAALPVACGHSLIVNPLAQT
jgi:hypothetical protein